MVDSVQRIRYGMTVRVCMYVCVREREREIETQGVWHREYASLMYIHKGEDSTTYKVRGGCFI